MVLHSISEPHWSASYGTSRPLKLEALYKRNCSDGLLGMNCMHSIDCISQQSTVLSAADQGSRQTYHFTSSHRTSTLLMYCNKEIFVGTAMLYIYIFAYPDF